MVGVRGLETFKGNQEQFITWFQTDGQLFRWLRSVASSAGSKQFQRLFHKQSLFIRKNDAAIGAGQLIAV